MLAIKQDTKKQELEKEKGEEIGGTEQEPIRTGRKKMEGVWK